MYHFLANTPNHQRFIYYTVGIQNQRNAHNGRHLVGQHFKKVPPDALS